MLSLLSLLLASGTVLRADTEEWTPTTYPDPRTNYTLCNTWQNSTLCDPDHILTDQWRSEINENINRQVLRLRETNILYTDTAPPECYDNSTEGVQIYVILAKRIQTVSNQTINNTELIEFGDKLAKEYGLYDQACKNYIILIGVEAAKSAYTRTGRDLKLPEDLMIRIYNQSENVFKEKNYMEGLNKMIDEIGNELVDPFKNETTEMPLPEPETESTTTAEEELATESIINATIIELLTEEEVTTTTALPLREVTPWWMFVLMGAAITLTIVALGLLLFNRRQAFNRLQMQTVIPLPNGTPMKSCSPSEGSNSEHFATIRVPRRRLVFESSLPPENGCDYSPQHKTDDDSSNFANPSDAEADQYCSTEELTRRGADSEGTPDIPECLTKIEIVEEIDTTISTPTPTPNQQDHRRMSTFHPPTLSNQLSTDVVVPNPPSPHNYQPPSPKPPAEHNENSTDNVISAF